MIQKKQDKQCTKVIRCCFSNPQILEYMNDNKYPIWQSLENNQFSFYLPSGNYLCLSDLLMGKKTKQIKVNQDALETLFIMLYDLLQELREKQLTYFLIKKEHIWVQLNDKAIIKLILTSPMDQVVSIFEEGSKTRIDRQVFQEIMDCFHEKQNKKQEDKFKIAIDKDLRHIKQLRQINRKPCIMVQDTLKKFINNIKIREKFEQQNINNQDRLLQTVLEVLPYFVFQNKIQKCDSSKALEELQNQLQKIYQYSQYDQHRYGLYIFLQFPETLMLFNDLQKFIQGDFFTQFQQFMSKTAGILQLFQQIESYFNLIPKIKIGILKEIDQQNLYQENAKLLDFIQEQVMKYFKEELNNIV